MLRSAWFRVELPRLNGTCVPAQIPEAPHDEKDHDIGFRHGPGGGSEWSVAPAAPDSTPRSHRECRIVRAFLNLSHERLPALGISQHPQQPCRDRWVSRLYLCRVAPSGCFGGITHAGPIVQRSPFLPLYASSFRSVSAAYNQAYAQLPQRYLNNLVVVDMWTPMVDINGWSLANMFLSDGVHVGPNGQDLVIGVIRDGLYSGLAR